MTSLEGTVERITFHSAADGYTVARLTPRGKQYVITVVGKLAGVRPGETLALEGEWREHREHGRQFEISSYRTLMPATIDGIRRYLGSGLIKGIGPATAKKITETFGKYTLDVIERTPDRLNEVPGLGRKKVELIKQAWQEQQQIKEVMLFLQELELPTGIAVRIYKHYGDAALEIVRSQPYRLADEVYGIGFLTADAIAAGLGMRRDDPQRIAAGLRYVLGQATDDGHCYLPAGELVTQASELLGVATEQVTAVLADPAALHAIEFGAGVDPALQPVYLAPLARAEQGVAAALRRLRRAESRIGPFYRAANWQRVFTHLAERRGVDLTVRQQEAIRIALTTPLSVLTGGPGTGKTTTLRTLIALLQARGYRAALASPTGRAAKRLADATGVAAQTIHRLLEYTPHNGGAFRRNSDWPLDCDLLVIDEVSMLDVLLANHLLKAVPAGAHVLLVGDADQLPSVGPGRVLRDLLESAAVPCVHLDTIFRQAADSAIITNAHRINNGELPVYAPALRNRSDGVATSNQPADFFFVNAPDPERCAALVVELVAERIPRRFGFAAQREIQVLVPTHKGSAGVANLNRLLQAALNPATPGVAERQFGSVVFRCGDRVMQLRNNYDLDVYNGDIGAITAVDEAAEQVEVRLDDGRVVRYEFAQLDELGPAYALSIHKSQGGEYPVVVVPLVMQHYNLLQRNLLYTAVTRARELVVLVGDQRAVKTAVDNYRVVERYSGLAARLNGIG